MFSVAFLIGVYANGIFFLGLANLLYPAVITGYTLVFLLLSVVFWQRFDDPISLKKIKDETKVLYRQEAVWMLLIVIAGGTVLIGALAPELAFDALWYHLTLSKIYLVEHGLRYIPGGLLYYSTMPKLGEMLYTAALALNSEILAKIVHMFFLVLTSIATYCIGLRYMKPKFALVAVVILLSNAVILWEATTSYIDLIRTFFELMALWGLLEYLKTRSIKWLIESSLLMGLAIQTKLLSVGTLAVIVVILFITLRKKGFFEPMKEILLYIFFASLIPLPWLVFSFVHTGNPFYPLFSLYQIHIGQDTLHFPGIILDPILIFLNSPDPLSPLYIMSLPLFLLVGKKRYRAISVLLLYSLLGLIVWALTPRTGGGRFILVLLPVLSIVAAFLISKVQQKGIMQISLISVLVIMSITLSYRIVASVTYLPVILGRESKEEFLLQNLNFNFGDFVDVGSEIKDRVGDKRVLLYGFHNLYYVDFPYIHESWVKKGDTFTYIATQNVKLPQRFQYWYPIYTNPKTGVTLYTTGRQWTY